MKLQFRLGKRESPARPWTNARRKKYAKTKRGKSLGNRYRKGPYWQVMTIHGKRYEHRVIMERIVGRSLRRDEHVHHKNQDTLDNSEANLELLTHSKHSTLHGKDRIKYLKKYWRTNKRHG